MDKPEQLMKDPSDGMDHPSPVQMDANDIDHLVEEEDKMHGNDNVFAPDPETVPYLTPELLNEEKEHDQYVNSPQGTDEEPEDKEEDVENTHQGRFRLAWEKIKSLTGTEVISGKGNDEITWKVIVSRDLDDFANNTKNKANLKGNQFDLLGNLGESILNFWCGDIWQQLEKMNKKLRKESINQVN